MTQKPEITTTDFYYEVPNTPADAQPAYKYNEGEIFKMLKAYIDKTYGEHYVTKSVQTIDVWDALGIGQEACQSNVLKYAMRLGKKDGHNPKDMMKILHYTILWYHFTFLKPREEATTTAIGRLESQLDSLNNGGPTRS